MTDITVKIEVEAVEQCVRRVLSLGPSSLGGNPLAKIVAESIADAAPAIRAKVQSILAAFVASPEMERNPRQNEAGVVWPEVHRDHGCGDGLLREEAAPLPEEPKP